MPLFISLVILVISLRLSLSLPLENIRIYILSKSEGKQNHIIAPEIQADIEIGLVSSENNEMRMPPDRWSRSPQKSSWLEGFLIGTLKCSSQPRIREQGEREGEREERLKTRDLGLGVPFPPLFIGEWWSCILKILTIIGRCAWVALVGIMPHFLDTELHGSCPLP